jgi:outer membrane protein assembly factor BamA
MGGNDQFQIEPNTRLQSKIRLIGGYGHNSYTNATGSKLSKVYAYDTSLKKNREVKKEFKVRTLPDSLSQQYTYGNYEYDLLLPFLLPGYNPDDGVFLGGGINYKKYKWNKPGIAVQHRIGANYAFETGAYNFLYEGFFSQVVGRWNLLANFYLNQPNYVFNFYGLGNNTEMMEDDKDYHRVRVEQAVAVAGLQRSWGAKHSTAILGDFLSTEVQDVDKRFVSSSNPSLDSSVFDRVDWIGATVSYTFSTRNDNFFPTKGIAVESAVQYHYSPTRSHDYSNYAGAFSWYVPIGSVVWTSRVGGAILSGDPQFFQYNQLSGLTNLRGYKRSRFSGKSMVYNNNELRIPVTTLNGFLVKGKLGINLFLDNGRVWIPEEDSDRWHVGYGGGVWIVPFQRISFTANYGVSKEDQVLYIKAGFLF